MAEMREGRETPQPETFPIMGSKRLTGIPWSLIAPHESQAQSNHGQTLRRLAERGGLDPTEAVAVLLDRDWQRMPLAEAEDILVSMSRQPTAPPETGPVDTYTALWWASLTDDQRWVEYRRLRALRPPDGHADPSETGPEEAVEVAFLRAAMESAVKDREYFLAAAKRLEPFVAPAVCTECHHLFTPGDLIAEAPDVWGHPCHGASGAAWCESHRVPTPPPPEGHAGLVAEEEAPRHE